jgi:hypothetical protein
MQPSVESFSPNASFSDPLILTYGPYEARSALSIRNLQVATPIFSAMFFCSFFDSDGIRNLFKLVPRFAHKKSTDKTSAR